MPDVLQNGSPRRDSNPSTDEDGNFILKHIFGGCSIGSIDPQRRHLHAVSKCDLVHAHRVETIVFLGLLRTTSEGIPERFGEISHLANMYRDIWVERARCDREGMPLVTRDGRDLQEEPLAGLVLHGWLLELDLHSIVRMPNDLVDLGLAPSPDFTVDSFCQIDSTGHQFPSPAFIAYAVIPERLAGKRRVRIDRVSDEAARSMCVHAQQERDEEVMRVPEGLERLPSYPMMSCGVHQKHTQEHDMSSDATSLCVVDLDCCFGPNLIPFDVEEVDVVSADMDAGEGEHRISNLPMEPLRLIEWQPSDVGS